MNTEARPAAAERKEPLESKEYAVPEFREKWERIGKGASETLPEASA